MPKKKKSKYYVRADGIHEASRMINGKRVVFRGRTDSEVERKMIEYKEKQELGLLFSEVAENWKEQHFKTLALSSLKGYKSAYERAINRFGNIPVKDLTLNDIDALLQSMGKQMYAKKTVSNQRLVINLICRSAVLDGIIRVNPCAEAKVPKGLKTTPRELPKDEELEIVKNTWNKPGGLLPYFILYTGCRRGEALAITHADINRKKKTISINKSVSYDNQRPFIKKPKTAAGVREIVLLDKLADVLPYGIGDALLFPNKDGGHMRQAQFERIWKHWQNSNGVVVTAHQLRHGYATMLFESGIPERDAMDLLGHSEISLTYNIYTHIRKSRKEQIAIKLNETANNF